MARTTFPPDEQNTSKEDALRMQGVFLLRNNHFCSIIWNMIYKEQEYGVEMVSFKKRIKLSV